LATQCGDEACQATNVRIGMLVDHAHELECEEIRLKTALRNITTETKKIETIMTEAIEKKRNYVRKRKLLTKGKLEGFW
jgi:hypothetical protein